MEVTRHPGTRQSHENQAIHGGSSFDLSEHPCSAILDLLARFRSQIAVEQTPPYAKKISEPLPVH